MAGSGVRPQQRQEESEPQPASALGSRATRRAHPDRTCSSSAGGAGGGLRLVRLYGSVTQCGASQPVAKVKMLKKLLSKPKSKKKKEAASSALPTLDRLHETLEMLEKKECFLQKKASAEVERAKDYTKAKNKSDTVDALRSGSSAVKAIHQSVSIDDIENAIEEANEHTENMRQIQEALATPIGASADFDEDELEAELEDLEEEELENELPEPPQRTNSIFVMEWGLASHLMLPPGCN
uniref:Charged multivesicular body protein 4b n=1 Tax=Oryza meridionalis TaxID=40149 RepID=A0A0E0F911_9ORYZ